MNKLLQISKIIKQSKTFFIAGHTSPDGDSLGSACALADFLNKQGKKAFVYCKDNIPPNLTHLKGISKIKKSSKSTDHFDCAIILESLNFARMGDIILPSQAKKIINIDHHLIASNFADVNYIVPDSSSVAELVLSVFEFMKIKPTKDQAQNLYIGLLTDTNRFQNTNVNPNSHKAAATLIKYGANPNEANRLIYSNETLASLKLLSSALSTLKILFDGKLAFMSLSKKMIDEAGAKDNDTGGIINYGLSIRGVKVSCLIKEIDESSTKFSFRSVKEINLLNIVKNLGGGGHKNAAGATVNKTLNESIVLLSQLFAKLK